LKGFHKWKNYETILENYDLYVYPRRSEGEIENQFKGHSKIHAVDAPIMEISSTFIRKNHKEGKNIRAMLPDAVWKYMDEILSKYFLPKGNGILFAQSDDRSEVVMCMEWVKLLEL